MIGQATQTILFYVLGTAAIFLALAVVSARKLLRAAVCLMGVLATSAGFYLLLGAEFLAGIQVLVYVGGIVILIVFAIMLTQATDLLEDRPPLLRAMLAAVSAAAFLALTGAALLFGDFGGADATPVPTATDTERIGRSLLDAGGGGYLLPFEIISLLLLAAVIGGIVVARKTPPPAQPFTTGGDRDGEARVDLPKSQAESQGGER